MERGTKAFVQVGCNGGAGIGIALRGGVAEEIVTALFLCLQGGQADGKGY